MLSIFSDFLVDFFNFSLVLVFKIFLNLVIYFLNYFFFFFNIIIEMFFFLELFFLIYIISFFFLIKLLLNNFLLSININNKNYISYLTINKYFFKIFYLYNFLFINKKA